MIACIENELAAQLHGKYQVRHDTNPEIIARVAKANAITAKDTSDLLRVYMECLENGTDILINVCSSVGDVADQAKEIFASAGMKIICIDDEMCRQAVNDYSRIGVIATLRSTLTPTCNRLKRSAEAIGKEIEITEILAENTFGIPQDILTEVLSGLAVENSNSFDALVLAQASMALCEKDIHNACGKAVYSSPRYCAKEVSGLVD